MHFQPTRHFKEQEYKKQLPRNLGETQSTGKREMSCTVQALQSASLVENVNQFQFSALWVIAAKSSMVLSKFVKTKVIEYWFETKSASTIGRKLRWIHGLKPELSSEPVVWMVKKFKSYVEFKSMWKKRSWWRQSEIAQDRVERTAEEEPKASCSRRS